MDDEDNNKDIVTNDVALIFDQDRDEETVSENVGKINQPMHENTVHTAHTKASDHPHSENASIIHAGRNATSSSNDNISPSNLHNSRNEKKSKKSKKTITHRLF